MFPEQLLQDLVTWENPGEYSMIDRFLGDAFGAFSCPFMSTFLQCVARLPIHTLNYFSVSPCSLWFQFSNWGVIECDIADRRSVAVLCMLYKIRCNPIHPMGCDLVWFCKDYYYHKIVAYSVLTRLPMVLYLCRMYKWGLPAVLWSHIKFKFCNIVNIVLPLYSSLQTSVCLCASSLQRPIISQIPTPVYTLSKQLNTIITEYLPSKYIINSTNEFLQIVHPMRPTGILASLDVDQRTSNRRHWNHMQQRTLQYPLLPSPNLCSLNYCLLVPPNAPSPT